MGPGRSQWSEPEVLRGLIMRLMGVDLNQVSEGHDACQPLGVRWIEPALHTNPVVVHPNAFGEASMAAPDDGGTRYRGRAALSAQRNGVVRARG